MTLPRAAFWPIGWSSDLRSRRPRAVTLLGTPLVAWRDASGAPRVLEDRCPHRAYPLSRGRIVSSELRCGYHGWSFRGDGACAAIPALHGEIAADRPERRAIARAALDAGGLSWACGVAGACGIAGATPPSGPQRIETGAGPGALALRWSFYLEASLADAAENVLDVPHTAFLHGGIFRKPGRGNPVSVRVSRDAGRIEASFAGEPVPTGLLGRVLAPQGGVVTHVDRFVMPCVAQVEYGLGPRLRIVSTTFLSPVGETRTRAFTVISIAPRALALAALPAFGPLAMLVLAQDARALRLQSANIARFPGARFTSTEVDVLGPHLRQMLERASRGEEPPPDAEWSATLVP